MPAFRRQLLALPAIAVVALAAACGSAGPGTASSSHAKHAKKGAHSATTTSPQKGGSTTTTTKGTGTTTTTTPGAPTTSAPPTSSLAALRAATWTSISLPADVCPNRTAAIQLSHGKATIPAPSGVDAPTGVNVAAGPHVFGDLYGAGHDIAAVNVWCAAAHGSASSELENSWVLYTDASGALQPIATLLPRQPAKAAKGLHVPYFDTKTGGIKIAPGAVTVKELWYSPKNAACCPSEHATTVWRAHGTSFSAYTTFGG